MKGMWLSGREGDTNIDRIRAKYVESLKEIERIEKMISTGDYQKSIFGWGINSEEEAIKALAKVGDKRDNWFGLMKDFRKDSLAVAQLPNERTSLTSAIEDMKEELAGNPGAYIAPYYHQNDQTHVSNNAAQYWGTSGSVDIKAQMISTR